MSEHTQEPWHIVKGIDRRWRIHSETVSHMADLGESGKQDARRIVACVNACEGISTETLEKVKLADVGNMHSALRDCVEQMVRARLFIENGVELGCIKMPNETLPAIKAAITNARKALGEQ